MPILFDPGYGHEPFRTLVQGVPDATVFPTKEHAERPCVTCRKKPGRPLPTTTARP
jgi:hypothetical protein